MTGVDTLASVVIPAHNEARTITRSLNHLLEGMWDEELDVLVVCNGCNDDTADLARAVAPAVRVLEIDQPSKAEAMRVGSDATAVFPRIHLDADVVLRGPDLRRLIAPLAAGTALAAAPERVLVTEGSSPVVRWYYDVWEHLPQVADGLFGRGVVALSEQGQQRVDALPPLLSDDLAASEAFAHGERVVVEDATVLVRAPRTVADLVRRRVRVITGNVQADRAGVRRPQSVTTWGDLGRLAAHHPTLVPKIPVFLLVTAVSRLRARAAVKAGDFTTWQRDESSRR
jgi:hypothetical protein